MEIKSWTVKYRNCDDGRRATGAVFAKDQQQALQKAEDSGVIDGRREWEVESIEPHAETSARIFIESFSERQQGGHFACPRCGKMTMNTDGVTRNALSRRAAVYICDCCGTEEALEDAGALPRLPLSGWAIIQAPNQWRCE